jgi:hypothetical protein
VSAADRAQRNPRVHARSLVTTFALCAVGLVGALPGSRGEPDPLALLAWLALCAPSVGVLAGSLELALWPLGVTVPALWAAALGSVDAFSRRDLPDPVWAAVCAAGLFLAGFALGRARPAQRWRDAASVFLFGLCAACACFAGEILRAPLPSTWSARLIDVSPITWLVESAGVDWMRHPSLYAAAGTVDIDPSLRGAFRPALAATIAFVVGSSLALASERRARALEAPVR